MQKNKLFAYVETYSEGGFPIEHDVELFNTKEEAMVYAESVIADKRTGTYSKVRGVDDFRKHREITMHNKNLSFRDAHEWYHLSVIEVNAPKEGA